MSSAKPKLLIVDDEEQIREVLGEILADDYQTVLASNGDEALVLSQSERPDLILLDVTMPGIDGIDVCDRLRQSRSTSDIPVIMLSAASHRENRIRAFNLGADDFISKPFDTDELLARIQAKLRRATDAGRSKAPQTLNCSNLALDPKNLAVFVDERPVRLSAIEFKLLKILLERQGELVKRKEILKKVWEGQPGSDRLIDAHMVSLRKRIQGFRGELKTIYGEGYVLRQAVTRDPRDQQ